LKNYWVIGDVHGCYYTLLKLISKLPTNSKLIFVGDLIDKGKYSYEVVDYVLKNNHIWIKGNHEQFFENYGVKSIQKDFKNLWNTNISYGGKNTLLSYKNKKNELLEHIKIIKKLPYFYKINQYFITHGFGLPYFKRRKKSMKQILSNRDIDKKYKHDWENYKDYNIINIFGHVNRKNVLIKKNYIGIDTGCVYGNKLTAIQLDTLNIIEQKTLIEDL